MKLVLKLEVDVEPTTDDKVLPADVAEYVVETVMMEKVPAMFGFDLKTATVRRIDIDQN